MKQLHAPHSYGSIVAVFAPGDLDDPASLASKTAVTVGDSLMSAAPGKFRHLRFFKNLLFSKTLYNNEPTHISFLAAVTMSAKREVVSAKEKVARLGKKGLPLHEDFEKAKKDLRAAEDALAYWREHAYNKPRGLTFDEEHLPELGGHEYYEAVVFGTLGLANAEYIMIREHNVIPVTDPRDGSLLADPETGNTVLADFLSKGFPSAVEKCGRCKDWRDGLKTVKVESGDGFIIAGPKTPFRVTSITKVLRLTDDEAKAAVVYVSNEGSVLLLNKGAQSARRLDSNIRQWISTVAHQLRMAGVGWQPSRDALVDPNMIAAIRSAKPDLPIYSFRNEEAPSQQTLCT